uniref:Uncharacterized protein n=1 Tax=Siphoviridae sp. ctEEM24 TaxID=2826203 RepID=A0A8S5LYQ0_9CAUD|nr:MAG TPA: hypothetical protein [Siphoviridae sp. ctEEM24]DAJ83682.1 MAG TPA: hypothetical protein [Caudoviricetes sp.]
MYADTSIPYRLINSKKKSMLSTTLIRSSMNLPSFPISLPDLR